MTEWKAYFTLWLNNIQYICRSQADIFILVIFGWGCLDTFFVSCSKRDYENSQLWKAGLVFLQSKNLILQYLMMKNLGIMKQRICLKYNYKANIWNFIKENHYTLKITSPWHSPFTCHLIQLFLYQVIRLNNTILENTVLTFLNSTGWIVSIWVSIWIKPINIISW